MEKKGKRILESEEKRKENTGEWRNKEGEYWRVEKKGWKILERGEGRKENTE